MTNQAIDRANELFSAYAGILKASQRWRSVSAPRTLYAMRYRATSSLETDFFCRFPIFYNY
jgi:hypothetical protein